MDPIARRAEQNPEGPRELPTFRRALMLLVVAVTAMTACSSPTTAPGPTPASTAASFSPPETATASAPETAAPALSPSLSPSPPSFDPDDRSTLVGVWGLQGPGEITFNDAGYYGILSTLTDERLENGTWDLAAGILRLEITAVTTPVACQIGVAEYEVSAGDARGRITLEPQQDACSNRKNALSLGLRWVGPAD